MLITDRNKNFSNISGVIKCRAKPSDNQKALTYILVTTKGEIVATDGTMLAWAMLLNLYPDTLFEPALHEVIKETKTSVFLEKVEGWKVSDYPKWDEVIPEISSKPNIKLYIENSKKRVEKTSINYARVIRYLPDDYAINFELFNRIAEGDYLVYVKDGKSPVQFRSIDINYLIMPCIIPKDIK